MKYASSLSNDHSKIYGKNRLIHPKFIQNEQEVNGFVFAVHFAFANHYPLVIKPDHIWLLITQALAIHVNSNSEALRKHFVQHKEKKTITVIDDSLMMGSDSNNWNRVFAGFSRDIAEQIGEDKVKEIVADFTTTTPTDKIASEIVLMETVKAYFDYQLLTKCGIPYILLEGEKKE